jgi:hypothetical protein
MNPALGFRGGHPLHPVGAAFIFHAAVGALSPDHGDDLLEAPHAGGVLAHDLHFPSAGLGIPAVHPEQVGGKEAASSPPVPARISRMTFLSSLGSLGTSRSFLIQLPWRRGPFETVDVRPGQAFHFGIRILHEFLAVRQLFGPPLILAENGHDLAQFGMLAAELFKRRPVPNNLRALSAVSTSLKRSSTPLSLSNIADLPAFLHQNHPRSIRPAGYRRSPEACSQDQTHKGTKAAEGNARCNRLSRAPGLDVRDRK